MAPKYINYSMSNYNNNIENKLFFKENLSIGNYNMYQYSQKQRDKDIENNNSI